MDITARLMKSPKAEVPPPYVVIAEGEPSMGQRRRGEEEIEDVAVQSYRIIRNGVLVDTEKIEAATRAEFQAAYKALIDDDRGKKRMAEKAKAKAITGG